MAAKGSKTNPDKSKQTAKPQSLSVTRSGYKFTASWKFKDANHNDGQNLQYRVAKSHDNKGNPVFKGSWKKLSLANPKTNKSKAFEFREADYYPTAKKPKFCGVQVHVRGNRSKYKTKKKIKGREQDYWYDPIASLWAEKIFDVRICGTPSVSFELNDNGDGGTFKWSCASGDHQWFSHWVYQTALTNGHKEPDWTKITTVIRSSASIPINEDTSVIYADSAGRTRWLRVKAVGPAGDSAWSKAKYHDYARPQTVEGLTATATFDENTNGFTCTAKWKTKASTSRPVTNLFVEYAIAQPEAGLSCPDNPGWTPALTITGGKGTVEDAATWSVDSTLGVDKCLFVRVNAQYDTENNIAYGIPVLAGGDGIGNLGNPQGLVAELDDTEYTAEVTAENTSQIEDSFLVVQYIGSDGKPINIGIIEHGETSVIVDCPHWTEAPSFQVYAAVGSYTAKAQADGVSVYSITEKARSQATIKQGGDVPDAPDVTLTRTSVAGTINVDWTGTWEDADGAELSWSERPDAWESTAEPSTYIVSRMHASQWKIAGLQTGITWYVRVRLFKGAEDARTFGVYSEIKDIALTSAPAVPSLDLSADVVTEDGSVIASWVYATIDGTDQYSAVLAEVTQTEVEGETVTAYTPLPYSITTQQRVTISIADMLERGWTTGSTHGIAVKVKSASGIESEGWSEPRYVSIADPVSIAITEVSLERESETIDGFTREYNALKELPMTITVTGAGANGVTRVVIERSDSFVAARPDESEFHGYEGETIAIVESEGEGQITITQDMLTGHLDDEGQYRIIATVQDEYGQSATATEMPMTVEDETVMFEPRFEVRWRHQAIEPEATVVIDSESGIALLTPTLPAGYTPETGDVCDIYRLSVDKPQLIVEGGSFGTTYVDPYPTIGEFGGHRFVYRTVNGDYTTADGHYAWLDTGENEDDYFESDVNIISFGDGQVELFYNVDVGNSWTKDFQETVYLGGAIQGDWNPAVRRTASVSTTAVAIWDQEMIEAMRRLSTYTGICHVRTRDGSSYAADVQVTDSYSHMKDMQVVNYSLKITRIDTEELDGATYAEWQESHNPEEEIEETEEP